MKKYLPSIKIIAIIGIDFAIFYNVTYPYSWPFAKLINSNPWFSPLAFIAMSGLTLFACFGFAYISFKYEEWRKK